jgi:hydrogenase small subunit
MSFLNANKPTVVDLITDFGLDVLWHPSLSVEMGKDTQQILADCASGARPLDVFVFEGSVIQGPDGSGRFDMFAERPMKDWVTDLTSVASIVVAIGSCATWGGLVAAEPNPTDSTGLQYHRGTPGGYLGSDWRSASGLPVINIPGCPAHPDWITQILVALGTGRVKDITLDELGRPRTFFTSFTHSGCSRNSFYEYKQDTEFFGEGTRTGCMFYELGCKGPLAHSSCNRILWNRQSSKTRAGMPCLGCTEPAFPFDDLAPGTVFTTQMIAGAVPRDMPPDQDHLTYLAMAGAAKVAAPQWAKDDMFVV